MIKFTNILNAIAEHGTNNSLGAENNDLFKKEFIPPEDFIEAMKIYKELKKDPKSAKKIQKILHKLGKEFAERQLNKNQEK